MNFFCPTKTKYFLVILYVGIPLLLILAVRTTQGQNAVQGSPLESVYIRSGTNLLILRDLRKRSDAYLLNGQPHSELQKFEVTSTVHIADTLRLVTFDYFEGFGLPAFRVTIGTNGIPLGLGKRIGSELIDDPK